MNIKKLAVAGIVFVAASALALDYVEVIDVAARQRYPWNGLVDIDFELDSHATEPYMMKVTVFDNVGKTNLPVNSVYTEGVSFTQNPTMVKTDTTRIIWDAAADLPNGFKCTNVLVTCQDERTIEDPRRYMIVDLSSGANAASFPVTYTNRPPAGGWTEEYMTTKLVLRRVEPGSFLMGSPIGEANHQSDETQHKVTLTKPFYIGVYEVTEAQFSLITGVSGTTTKPVQKTWQAIRGYDVGNAATLTTKKRQTSSYIYFTNIVTQSKVATDFAWPSSSEVEGTSFLGKLRNKTSLQFDLPTEAQWEYACLAGSSAPMNIGEIVSGANSALVQGAEKLDATGTHYIYIGNYMPNALGLYDMTGNVSEWCLDVYKANLGTSDAVDPIGSLSYESKELLSNVLMHEIYMSQDATITLGGNTTTLPSTGYSGVGWYCFYYVTYVANGVRRVTRGGESRIASRSSGLNINTTGAIFTSGVVLKGPNGTGGTFTKTKKATYTNPVAGIRVALTVEE